MDDQGIAEQVFKMPWFNCEFLFLFFADVLGPLGQRHDRYSLASVVWRQNYMFAGVAIASILCGWQQSGYLPKLVTQH
jgi:hypothetical protein